MNILDGSGPEPYLHKKLMENIKKRYGIKFPKSKSKKKSKSKFKSKFKLKNKSPLKSEINGNSKILMETTLSGGKRQLTDKEKEKMKEYYKKNKEYFKKGMEKRNKEKIKKKNKEYYEKNKEDILKHNKSYIKEYYKKNKEYLKKYQKEYQEKNKIAKALLELSKSGSELFTQSAGGKIRSQYYGKMSKVMVKVPENVKNTALYSFKLKKLGFKGGLETGWKRAKQLATKSSISIKDLKYMRAWFARHLYTSYPTYKKWKAVGRPKDNSWHNRRGIISWLIWGADAAFKWVNSQKNINLLNKNYPGKNYKALKLK